MEPVSDYELKAFFTYVIEILESLGIPYMVVGGFAAILYGEPRLTIDVDIVVEMKEEHIGPLVAAFSIPDYYVSEEAIRDSLPRRFPFNIIQPATGAKGSLRNSFLFSILAKVILSLSKGGFCGPEAPEPARNHPSTSSG
jgi:hypothetical protein